MATALEIVLIVLFIPVLNTSTTFYGDVKNDFKQLKYILINIYKLTTYQRWSASTELKNVI